MKTSALPHFMFDRMLSVTLSKPAGVSPSMMLRRQLPLLLLFSVGCDFAVEGDGNKVERSLQLEGFDRVENASELDVRVHRGLEFSVRVTIDDNLYRFVDLRLQAGVLRIQTDQPISFEGIGRVEIELPRLVGAAAEGSGVLEIDGDAEPEDFDLVLSGSGDAAICGGMKSLDVELSGSGRLSACSGDGTLSLERLSLRSVGSGAFDWDGPVHTVEMDLSGSGDAVLSGRAQSLSADLSGSGALDAEDFTATNATFRSSGSGAVHARVEERATVRISGSGDVELWGSADVDLESNTGSGVVIQH